MHEFVRMISRLKFVFIRETTLSGSTSTIQLTICKEYLGRNDKSSRKKQNYNWANLITM